MLTSDQLRDVIAQGEQLDVEFAGAAPADTELIETVSCLANARGGVVIIGVEDDGRITGAQPRHGTYTDPRHVIAYSDGEVRYKTSIDLGGTPLTAPVIKALVYSNVALMDRYLPGIMAIMYNDSTTPAAEIQKIEG